MDKSSREYEVCLCKHIDRGQVEDFVRERGITDLKTLCEEMEVGDRCGGCREDLENIINEVNATK